MPIKGTIHPLDLVKTTKHERFRQVTEQWHDPAGSSEQHKKNEWAFDIDGGGGGVSAIKWLELFFETSGLV